MPTQPAPSNSGTTYGQFFNSFLKGLGLTNLSNQQRVIDEQALADIVHYEGLNTYHNPFNVTYDPSRPATKGVANFNSVGVQEYATDQAGLNASVAFFGAGRNPVWNDFIQSLTSGTHNQIVSAVDKAYQSWGSNGPSNYGTGTENQIITTSEGSGKVLPLPSVPSNWDVLKGAIGQTASDITSPFQLASTIWSDVTTADFWIRVGFVLLGFFIVLIAIDKTFDVNVSPVGLK